VSVLTINYNFKPKILVSYLFYKAEVVFILLF